MLMIENIILNAVYILFPLTVYLIYVAYIRNMDLKEKSIFLEVALFSSLYLIIRYGVKISELYSMILFNIPLLISYMKKKNFTSIIISIILIIYYYNYLHTNLLILILEYTIYFVTYNYLCKKRPTTKYIINNFVIIKSFIMSLEANFILNPNRAFVSNIWDVFVGMLIFTIFSYVCFYFFNWATEMLNLNSTLRELKKEKDLRCALFKLTHEIKNPIAVCKGYLTMLDYNDEKQIRKYIPIIKGEIERCIVLMDDFLDYTKVKIKKEEVDLYMLLEEVWASVEPLLKKNKIEGKLDIPDDELYIDLDYNRIKQVLVNILKNSIEAYDDKKNKKTITLDTVLKKDSIVIRIKDNGKGMEEEVLENIGEMFYTTKEKGTGLGVRLSKEIVELHNGSLKYRSTLGKGTTAFISFPFCKKETSF